ncbi:MAG: hypothetical protein U0002_00065 [Thermoanaerobaculia bacterium]
MSREQRTKELREGERLREWLRQGDPFEEAAGLSPAEAERIERRMLAELAREQEKRKRGWLLPALAGAAAASLGLGLALSWPRPPSEVSRVARAESPAPQMPATAPNVSPSALPQEEPEAHRRPRRAASRAPRPQPGAEPRAGLRQFSFETPGGTRVVWVLNPDLDLSAGRTR